jgi:predicted TPR repeat methyltransferase
MDIQNAYNEWSGIYDSNQNLTRDLDAQVTRETLAGQRFASVLELGCGTGKNTVFLAGISDRLHAFDFSDGMIQKAREKVKSDNVCFEIADLTQRWHCDDSAYDLIINELHPFKQYGGSKARFERGADVVEVDVFVHHISEFINAAQVHGLTLVKFNEYWHAEDGGKPPRLVSFVFGDG